MRMLRGRCYLAVVCLVLLSMVYGLYHLFNKYDSYYNIRESPHSKAFREHHGGMFLFYEPVFNSNVSYPTRQTEEHLENINSSLMSLTKMTETHLLQHKSSAIKPSAVEPKTLVTAEKLFAVEAKFRMAANKHSAVKSDIRLHGDMISTVVTPRVELPRFEQSLRDDDHRKLFDLKNGRRQKMTYQSSPPGIQSLLKAKTYAKSPSPFVSTTNGTLSRVKKQTLVAQLPVGQSSVAETRVTMDSTLTRERRRQAQTKIKQMEEKVWFQQNVADIMKGVKEGGVVEVQKKPDEGPPAEVDPKYWEGLESALVYTKYPGLKLEANYIFNRSFLAPEDPMAAGMQGNPKTIDELTEGQAEERFYQLISVVHVDCRLIQRMGSVNDGGWDLCTVPPYTFRPGCLVYSFGINYDFTFDDAMATAFNCTVKSFDPSMTVSDHVRSSNVLFFQLGLGPENTVTDKGWKLMSLQSIMSKLGHSRAIIDVIKMDIDYNEWSCIQTMANDGSLDNVKQLIFEIHTKEVETVQRPTSKQDFVDMYDSLLALERAGFRRYNYHYNTLGQYTSIRTGKTRSCCYELYYINIRFLNN